jgi:hypothetical protein
MKLLSDRIIIFCSFFPQVVRKGTTDALLLDKHLHQMLLAMK